MAVVEAADLVKKVEEAVSRASESSSEALPALDAVAELKVSENLPTRCLLEAALPITHSLSRIVEYI